MVKQLNTMEDKMSKIDDLISPKREVTFRGEKFMLDAGFTLEETPAINLAFGQKDPETRALGMKQLLKVIIKRLYPIATEEQISKVDASYSQDILEVFFQMDKMSGVEENQIKKTLEAVKVAK